MIHRETLPDGGLRLSTAGCSYTITRLRPGALFLVIAGQETGDGQTITRQEQSPQVGATNPSLVPYRDVYQNYAAAAAETMDREHIPPEMRDLVRDYFSQLAPE